MFINKDLSFHAEKIGTGVLNTACAWPDLTHIPLHRFKPNQVLAAPRVCTISMQYLQCHVK